MKDLNKIRMLSYRLVGGVQGKGINLTLLYIPDLSRYHIRRLVRAGYGDLNSFKDASGDELGKLIPKRLVQRIQIKIKEDNNQQKMLKAKWIAEAENCEPVTLPSPLKTTIITSASHNLKPVYISFPSKTENPNSNLKPKNQKPKNVLEISLNRPDRIIFMGENIGVTATEFSLIHLLAQHNEQVMSYDELVDELWGDEENAIYSRVSYHFSKIRSTILKTIGKSKRNKEKVKNIFKVISRRGIMLNLEEEKLKIS